MTTAENFRRARNLFDAALERPAAEREAYLRDACVGAPELLEEVQALLAARDRPENRIDRPAMGDRPQRLEGRRIGPYEILREIASGGMGTVYLARRADGAFDMRVALKVLRPEAATFEVMKRFQQERQILAAFDHPNIARILDGGETGDGLPYIAMEFVDGLPIDRYCEEHRLNVTERLQIFRAVCGAVRYAHQHGVVHRDLKPSNILVTAEGAPKLLDFGISKIIAPADDGATACVTRTGLCLMTPEYASPEQIRGESVAAATDVYSLGVVLYELVTGHRPYRLRSRVYHEIVRAICEEPPTRPSTVITQKEDGERTVLIPEGSLVALRRRLAGDLDAVLLKTLEKQPFHRYRTIDALDAEIARHLNGNPVEARHPLPFEVARRFAAQYSAWILGLTIVAVLVATDLVKVHREVLLVGASLGLGLLFMLAVYSSELGSAMAKRLLRVSAITMVVAGGIGAAIAVALPKSWGPDLLSLINLGATAAIAFCFVRWPFRDRWAGRLLLDLRRRLPLWIPIVVFIAGAAMVYQPYRGLPHRWDFREASSFAQVFALCAWIFFFYARSEIREGGFLAFGQFFPWRRIESRWCDDAKGKGAMLHLQCSGFRRICPQIAYVLPAGVKAQATAIFERYLSQWPQDGKLRPDATP